jgi:hypothetical protein
VRLAIKNNKLVCAETGEEVEGIVEYTPTFSPTLVCLTIQVSNQDLDRQPPSNERESSEYDDLFNMVEKNPEQRVYQVGDIYHDGKWRWQLISPNTWQLIDAPFPVRIGTGVTVTMPSAELKRPFAEQLQDKQELFVGPWMRDKVFIQGKDGGLWQNWTSNTTNASGQIFTCSSIDDHQMNISDTIAWLACPSCNTFVTYPHECSSGAG